MSKQLRVILSTLEFLFLLPSFITIAIASLLFPSEHKYNQSVPSQREAGLEISDRIRQIMTDIWTTPNKSPSGRIFVREDYRKPLIREDLGLQIGHDKNIPFTLRKYHMN